MKNTVWVIRWHKTYAIRFLVKKYGQNFLFRKN